MVAGETSTIIVPFTGFTGRYVFHCHNLEHEDMRMMANFEVVA
jgi:spore coat protein A